MRVCFLSADSTGIHHNYAFANKVKLWDFDTSQGKDLYMNGCVQHFFFRKKSLNVNKMFLMQSFFLYFSYGFLKMMVSITSKFSDLRDIAS